MTTEIFTFYDAQPNYYLTISSTPAIVVTTIGTVITTTTVFSDALPARRPSEFDFSPTLIWSYGGSGSNSYVDETMITSFMTSVLNNEAWQAASWRDRRAAIIEATRDIDSGIYIGGRYYYDQLLEFPRTIQISFPWNRTSSSSTVWTVTMYRMEQTVKQATCWQTLHILQTRGNPRYNEMVASGIRAKSSSIGGASASVNLASNIQRLCPQTLALLKDWKTTRRVLRG